MTTNYFPIASETAQKYTRAHTVLISNPLNGAHQVTFKKERVMMDAVEAVTRPDGSTTEVFTYENENEEFQLVNPLTGDPIGQTMTYLEAKIMVFSLFFHMEQKALAETPEVE